MWVCAVTRSGFATLPNVTDDMHKHTHAHTHTHTHKHTRAHTHMYIYIYDMVVFDMYFRPVGEIVSELYAR